MTCKRVNNDKGFSLVELVIAVVVLGIVSIVAISGLYHWVTKSRQNTDITNCNIIKEALGASVQSSDFPSLGYKYCWIAKTRKRVSNPSKPNPEKDNTENPFGQSFVLNTDGSEVGDKAKFESWYTKSLSSKKFSDNTYDSLINSKTGNNYTVLVYVNEIGDIYDIKVILTKNTGFNMRQLKSIINYYDSDFIKSSTNPETVIVYDGINKFFD